MTKDSDPLAGVFETRESGGLFAGFLAEENEFNRGMMWRLGSWGVAAVAAVVIAVMANQAHLGWRRDQVAAAEIAQQAQQLQILTKESQNESRRLASAIETLNTDRDRLYSRVTVLEQGLDSVTGAIAKQSAAAALQQQEPASKPQDTQAAPSPTAPSVAPVASTPAPGDKPRADAASDRAKEPVKEQAKEQSREPPPQTAAAASLVAQSSSAGLPSVPPLVASNSIMAPPDPAASKLVQPEKAERTENTDKPDTPKAEATTAVAVAAPATGPEAAETEAPAPAIAVQQTRFAVDLGSANSIGGLRALWLGLIKSNPELATLRPIIMIRESKTGLGMQLRLGAGPLINAAAAAKICAGLTENERACETTVFDGQRLSMRGGQEAAPQASPEVQPPPAAAKPEKPQHRRSYSKRTKREEPPPPPPAAAAPPPKQEATAASTLSSFFSRNKN